MKFIVFSFVLSLVCCGAQASSVRLADPQVLNVLDKNGSTIPQWIDPSIKVHIEVQLVMPKVGSNKTGIVVIPGSGAGLPVAKAEEFAALGYPALAVRYFDYNPKSVFNFSITQLPLESFKTAVVYLKTAVPSLKKIVLHGRSRGGEAALLVGSTYPKLFDGIIAEVPSSHAWGDRANGIWSQYAMLQPDPSAELASWVIDNTPFPFISMPSWLQTYSTETTLNDLPNYVYRTAYDNAFKKAKVKNRKKARIKVENISSPLFLTGGGNDQIWPSDTYVQNVRSSRKAAGKADKDFYIINKQAGHIWSSDAEEPILFPSGVYDFAKNDFSDICVEENLENFLKSIKPMSSPVPTSPATYSGFPYKGHIDEILKICSKPDAELYYYLAPEYAEVGGNAKVNGKMGKITWKKIQLFLKNL